MLCSTLGSGGLGSTLLYKVPMISGMLSSEGLEGLEWIERRSREEDSAAWCFCLSKKELK